MERIKINFICYGNICRSTMAEFLFKRYVELKGVSDKFYICSSATSSEEIGNPVHYGTRKILDKYGIDYSKKRAVQVTKADYDKYDYFICMDARNFRALGRIFDGDTKGKVKPLLSFVGLDRDVLDPYFTLDFEATEADINLAMPSLFDYLIKE